MEIKIKRPEFAEYQKGFLYNKARFTITEASTKAGKTFAHIFWIFERAHERWNKPGYNHWWVAPVYSQSKIAFDRMRRSVGKTGLYRINETSLSITCPNGAIIRFKTADKPDNLYGDDVHSIVFDEAPRAKVEAYYALRSTITATGGKIKMIGNFGGVANWMHQLKEKTKNDPEYKYFKVNAWDAVEAGILDRAEIDQAKRDLPENVFKSLYLAEASEDENQLLSYATINSLWKNDFVEEGVKYMTCDIALLGSDKFVIGVWSGWQLIDLIIREKIESNQVVELIKSVQKKHKVQVQNITYDADGLGNFLHGYLSGAKPFHNGGKVLGRINYKNLKSQCSYELAKHINEVGMWINCEVDKSMIIEELECLKSYKLDDDGKIQIFPKAKIKEKIGRSPDILDVLTMRMIFEIDNSFFEENPIQFYDF